MLLIVSSHIIFTGYTDIKTKFIIKSLINILVAAVFKSMFSMVI